MKNPTRPWTDLLEKAANREVLICGFGKNHCAGHAPATVKLFIELRNAATETVIGSSNGIQTRTLFD